MKKCSTAWSNFISKGCFLKWLYCFILSQAICESLVPLHQQLVKTDFFFNNLVNIYTILSSSLFIQVGSGRSLQSSGIVCVCVCVCFIKAYQLDLFPSRLLNLNLDFPCGSDVKVSAYNACRRPRFIPWVRKIAWRRKWQPTPVHLPGESHGWRSLVGYSPWGRKESDTTEQLHQEDFYFSH